MEKKRLTALDRAMQSYYEIQKRLVTTNAKLESIKNALPNHCTIQYWESGPRTFAEKIRAIIDAP